MTHITVSIMENVELVRNPYKLANKKTTTVYALRLRVLTQMHTCQWSFLVGQKDCI